MDSRRLDAGVGERGGDRTEVKKLNPEKMVKVRDR